MDLIDVKYIRLISSRLQNFKQVKNNLFNFRCPICGDSKRNKSKSRGYFYQIKNNTNYKCHNCGVNISFNNFLKTFDPILNKQYVFEKFKKGHTGKNYQTNDPKFNFSIPKFKAKLDLPKASSDENAKKYLLGRNLNPDFFYYTENFKKWVNSVKSSFDDLTQDEPRIVIPLYFKKRLIGIQGRALNKNSIRYITIMFEENVPKIYGLDNIQKNQIIYITEGIFDSFFIKNSIALCGADGEVSSWVSGEKVWVYDNEPRNREILKRIEKCIDLGEKVVIWPSSVNEKDPNSMALAGHDVQSVVESNTYSGLEAKLKFTNWKKHE